METTERYVRDICELLIDSKLGYGDVARRADDHRLRTLLQQIGESRMGMIASTANLIEGKADTIPHRGTVKGSLHRVWMAVRDLLSSTSDVNLIAECHRGESYLIGKYDEALRYAALPHDVRALLTGQRAELMANVMGIRALDGVLSDA